MWPFSGSPLHRDVSRVATKLDAAAVTTSAQAQQKRVATYDYVIIGGGTAGCVLASRLSEDPDKTVLLVEAGDDNTVLHSRVPITFGKLFHSKHDWDYYTVQQSEKLGGQEMFWPRGKLLGGCSSINAMMYQQGSPFDLDDWANKHGCTGYSYADMAPYARRLEKYTTNPSWPALDAQHRGGVGEGGVVEVGHHSYLNEITGKGFLGAVKQLGLEVVDDINTPKGCLGAVRFMTFVDSKGQRSSAATAYLPPEVQGRANLTIVLETRATRVLLDRSGAKPRAFGVELQQHSARSPKYVAAARKEVIVCGGAVNTPQTLMLSGIGPAEELRRHGVDVVVDSPHVGRHLKDHLVASPCMVRAKPQYTMDYLASDINAIPGLIRWLATGTGALTSNVGEVATFFNSTAPNLPKALESLTRPENRAENNGSAGVGPDIEIIGAALAFKDHGATSAPKGDGVLTLAAIGLRPRSEGTITLKSSSVWDKAVIDARYWSDEGDNDRKALLAGVRACMRIMRAPALQPYLVPPPRRTNDIKDFYFPYCADHDAVTDEQLMEWMGRDAFTLYHPIGTARLGPNAEDAAVDLEMKVHGVEGLRVCDASVFADQISGHPTALILALAEKCSDLVRANEARAVVESQAPASSYSLPRARMA